MRCPYCNKEMINGVVQSARKIFFTTKPHKWYFSPSLSGENNEVGLSYNDFTGPTCVAYHCAECKKVIIDYTIEKE